MSNARSSSQSQETHDHVPTSSVVVSGKIDARRVGGLKVTDADRLLLQRRIMAQGGIVHSGHGNRDEMFA